MATSYYRVMLGKKSQYANECFVGNFIGADFGIKDNLTHRLPEEWKAFNKEIIPVVMAADPKKTKIGAGLACGALWTISKGIRQGDMVLCPDGAGTGTYRVGRIVGDYYYAEEQVLPHRRKVEWLDNTLERSAMSEPLLHSSGSVGTVSNVTK
jgi:restriction system protein